MEMYLALVVLIPLLGAIINTTVGMRLPRPLSTGIACASIFGSFLCALLTFVQFNGPQSIEYFTWFEAFNLHAGASVYLDSLSAVMILMVTFVSFVIHVYATGYMAHDENYARFFALLNWFVFAMLVLVLAESLPFQFLGWEGVGFCSYGLISFWFHEDKNVVAGNKAFITTRVGDFAYGIAIVWLFSKFGTVSITQLNSQVSTLDVATATAIGLLFLVGAMGKSAQMPLMVWLPDAMAGPTPVSALIHAATMVTAGVYLLARLFPLISMSPVALAAVALTGGITAFYAATCALAQRDLKRVLAYSTISQIGYMILGVGSGALTSATCHLLVHAFFKAVLFLGAGCILTALHHETDIFKMGGLRKRLPLTFMLFLAGGFCLAGFPLTGGFFSKDAILAAVFLKGGPVYGSLYFLGTVTAFLTAVYTFRMLYVVFGGSEPEHLHVEHLPRFMELVLIPLALLGLCGGLLNLPEFLGEGWLRGFLAGLPASAEPEVPHQLELVLQGVAAAISLAGIAVAHLIYSADRWRARPGITTPPSEVGGAAGFFLNGWRFDLLYSTLFVKPYEAISTFTKGFVDETVINGSIDLLGSVTGKIGQGLARWTTGSVGVYMLSFVAGAVALLVYTAWLVLS